MEMEKEITVLVKTSYENLIKELEQNNFEIKEEYQVNDIYLIDKNVDILNTNSLDILKKSILVRDVVGIEKELLYKYKKYDNIGNILEQGKVSCPVLDINKALEFMKSINYIELFKIYDKCTVFANDKSELTVQQVNNNYIFIEMETKSEYLNKEYENISELIANICSYNISIDKTNFFVKKAEIILNEKVRNNT